MYALLEVTRKPVGEYSEDVDECYKILIFDNHSQRDFAYEYMHKQGKTVHMVFANHIPDAKRWIAQKALEKLTDQERNHIREMWANNEKVVGDSL